MVKSVSNEQFFLIGSRMKYYTFFLLFGIATNSMAAAELNLPEIDKSMEAIQEHITGILPFDSQLFLFSNQTPIFIKGSYSSTSKTRDGRFGAMSTWSRQEVRKVPLTTTFVGGIKLPKGFLFVDGRNLLTYYLDQDYQVNSSGSVIWDRIRPNKDSVGEAPKYETEQLRKKYIKEMSEADNKVRSLAFKDKTKEYYNFYVLTGSNHSPLAEMKCLAEKPINCEISRQCQIPLKAGKPNYLRGLAYDTKREMLAIGNLEDNSISYFKIGKCNGKQIVTSRKLNKKFKLVSSLYFDEQSTLWVGTEARDDYLNASVYQFEKWN